MRSVCCREPVLSICPADNYFFTAILTSPSAILCSTVNQSMNLLLFFYADKPTFVAALITCDCAQKVEGALLIQSWHDDGKFTN
jgi:hypothetical protein